MGRGALHSFRVVAVAIGLAALGLPASALAHVERPSYWPDPAADTAVSPPAGGGVPRARSLGSALIASRPGTTRVVCKRDSLTRLNASIARARRSGYDIRPSDHRRFSVAKATRLRRINSALMRLCRFSEIQPAVTASGNNDRVVVMPGLYTEPTARSAPTNDPRCDPYQISGDRPGEEGTALSYTYQFNCPNDQNLVAVMGRTPGTGSDPQPPRRDRHGIPNLGPCIRCNFQIEGSGVSADDVIIEAGNPAAGNRGPSGNGSRKDVGIRADRADGFVLRNMTVRHAGEHGIYVIEADGYLLERFKTFFNKLYGTLTFVEDHGLTQDCEAVGHGDSGLYPGGPVETGVQRPAGTAFRYNQEIRRCDMHHNLAGYSATNGNAVHIHNNEVYDNALGLQTDVVTGAGHPGYPGDSSLFERNNIHSNNFNPYLANSDVHAAFPFPVGTGMWIAGGNYHTIRDNNIYDNWRRGTMLFSVPDSLICGPQTQNSQAGCEPDQVTTSHFNRNHGNRMGIAPNGRRMPNGTDNWWDDFPNSQGNCWYGNSGPSPITTSPSPLPDCANGTNQSQSMGKGNPANEGELIGCLAAFASDNEVQASCPWFQTPPRPGSSAALRAQRQEPGEQKRRASELKAFCEDIGPAATCKPFERYFK